MSVDTYAPSSALSFLDMDDNELLRGADTQPTQYDYRDFTMPSTSQSQTQGDQLELQVSKVSDTARQHGPGQVRATCIISQLSFNVSFFFFLCLCMFLFFHCFFVFMFVFVFVFDAF